MKVFLCLLAAGVYLCFIQVNSEVNLSRQLIENVVNEAKEKVDRDYEFSRTESLARIKRNGARPAYVLRLMKQPRGSTRSAVRSADYMEQAIRLIQKRSLQKHHILKRSLNATDLISPEDLKTIADLTGCSARVLSPTCENTPNVNKFRTANSVCNNRDYPYRGSANTPFVRWLPAEYQDGISIPKGWDPELPVNHHLLPLVREVSNRILSTANTHMENDLLYTHLAVIFGQWSDHDLTFTPDTSSIRSFETGINCEESCERTDPCFPIEIPKNDPRFGSNTCMPFFRSSPACSNTVDEFGNKNVRQQMNALTAFIDGGQVYGSDEAKARSLRDLTNDKGLLRVNTEYTDNGRELLPFMKMEVNICATRASMTNDSSAVEVPCFFAGDERSNENIALTSLHTLMLREHNRLARELAKLNPLWTGDRLYLEARKILGAYLQVFTFRDYLLHIVGPNFVAEQLSTYPGYSEEVDPSISNVFATAAYRFAHLTIQPLIFRLDEEYHEHPLYPSPPLHKAFFAPWRVVFEGGIDPILRGVVGRQAKLSTHEDMMHDELRQRLFQFTSNLALDLAALNLQRGRDHGLPGYNKWRKFCGLSQPRNLEELAEVMNNTELAAGLLELYGTADNIDVWLGGVAEGFVPSGRVGPLFACLIATQFQNIRRGDRLWWQNEGVFTEAQRASLTRASLSRIICDNTGITDVPERPLLYRPRSSGYKPCAQIPAFDLSPWKDRRANFPPRRSPFAVVDIPSSPTDIPLSGRRDFSAAPNPLSGQRAFFANLPSGQRAFSPVANTPSSGQSKPPGSPVPKTNRGFTEPPGANKPAFAMRLGFDKNLKPDQPIPFHDVIYNRRNHYDTETGVFTCVEPGIYEFEFHCIIYHNAGFVDLQVNGELGLHSFTTKEGDHWEASGTVPLVLKTGDKVWVSVNFSGDGLSADSYFTGRLLYTV